MDYIIIAKNPMITGQKLTLFILYSADYELFLGGNNHNETEVLIEPTNALLNTFDDVAVPLTLFADVFSFLRYREQNLFDFPGEAENQLKDAIRRGHDVQSHVHPHWSFTSFQDNKFLFDTKYFLLGNLDEDKEKLYRLILKYLVDSRIYLHELLTPVDSRYHCIAYRAGGYGLQPNSDIVIRALIDAGFIIDSSIVPNLVNTNHVNAIDFSIVPKTANYYLDSDLCSPSLTNRGIFEIPIASCNLPVREVAWKKFQFLVKECKNNIVDQPDSSKNKKITGYTIQSTEKLSGISRYSDLIKKSLNRFFILNCTTDDNIMFQCTKRYLNQFDNRNNDVFFSCTMHPKEMTAANFSALKKYHETLKTYYGEDIQAISYQDAAEMLKKTGRPSHS